MKAQNLILSMTAIACLAGTYALPANAKGKGAKASAKTATAATTYKVDPAASTLGWTGSKVLVNSAHNGTIAIKSGSVEVAGTEIKGGSFEIDMKTIKNLDLASSPNDQKKLEGHLNSPDFFDVEKFPTATFKIKSVKAIPNAAAGAPTHEITGDLTLKDITKPIGTAENPAIPAIVTINDTTAEATAKFEIDRTTWNVKYNSGKFFKELGDKVIADKIKFDLKLVAKK